MIRPPGKDSIVLCKNSHGDQVRGTLMNFSGGNVVFEVYNPFSVLQLSEVLRDFQIVFGEHVIYSGRCIVGGLVNTGFMYVVEATLVDPIDTMDSMSLIKDKSKLAEEVSRFITDWQVANSIIPPFKLLISDLKAFLYELRSWSKEFDAAISSEPGDEKDHISSDLTDKIFEPVAPILNGYFQELEKLANNEIPPDKAPIHKAFTRRELHPLILCSPFIHRTYTKPLGYAGDYEMINQVLSDPRKGNLLFAKLINQVTLSAAPAEAHRNRITILTKLLESEGQRTRERNQPFKVMNVACGPAKEVRNFMASCSDADRCEITLLDFSPEALAFCKKELRKLKQFTGSNIKDEYVEKSIDVLLRESIKLTKNMAAPSETTYDFVYCAGLFDYLTDSVCSRLISLFHNWLSPGGLLAVTNIHPKNEARNFMEYLLEWIVIHRDESHLERLALVDGEKTVYGDDTGVNIFLTVRKA